jgi:formate dehydrogenase major subunit
MTLHFPDDVETNVLTIDAWDKKSGTAEFKATAIRVEALPPVSGDEVAATAKSDDEATLAVAGG